MVYGPGGGWGTGAIAFLLGLLMLTAIVVLVIIAVRMLRGGGVQTPHGVGQPGGLGSARQILDERFARGEIGVEEYHDRRRHLEA